MSESHRCTRCGTRYPPHLVGTAFRTVRRRMHQASRQAGNVCRPCEQTGRDERKIGDRWAVKARDVIRRHATRLGVSKDDLINVHGWDSARLAHDAEFQYGNGCNYCGHSYQAMGHGLADITLDIVDRARPPHYRTNTRWCCQTCNRKKGVMTPDAFEADRQIYDLWNRQQDASAEERGFLFDLTATA